MLHPTMSREALEEWANEHHVSYALTYPAKMLLVPTSRLHTSWLWVHQQNNTPIWEIITRPSAHTVADSNQSNAPLDFQQAAIQFLEAAGENAQQALIEEAELLIQPPPAQPILQNLHARLIEYRSTLRSQIHPRSKQDRHTQQLWLDNKRYLLQYKEESIAWCGGGNWADLSIHLDERPKLISCKCNQGQRASCRFALSAIDQTLEMLLDTSQSLLHDQIIRLVGTPKWLQDFELIDKLLDSPIQNPDEQLGWRLKETKQGFQVEPVWCIYSTNGWKQKKAPLAEILSSNLSAQDEVISQLLLVPGTKNIGAILHLLEDHPRVFIGSRSHETGAILSQNISLHLQNTPLGIEWSFKVADITIPVFDILQQLQISQLNVWYKLDNNSCSYVKISHQLQEFIETMNSFMQIIPKDAYAALFKRIPKIESLLSISLDNELRGEEINADSRPVIQITSASSEQLRVEFLAQPLGSHYHPIGSGKTHLYHFNSQKETFQFCTRDFEQELANVQLLRKLLNLTQKQNYQWTLTDPGTIFIVLSTLQNLPPAYLNRIEWLINRPQIRHISAPDLKIDIFNTEEGFQVDGELITETEPISLWEVLPAARTKSPYLLVRGHVWYSIEEHFRKHLTLLADTITPTQSKLLISTSHSLTLNELLNNGFDGDHTPIQQAVSNIHPLRFNPANFAYTLRPYQIEAVEWMLSLQQWSAGAILADEMGLGKTIQTLAFIHQIQMDIQEKTLIVAPKSTLHHWQNQADRCLPDWDIALYDGPNRADLLNSLFSKQCLIMTYDIVTKDIELLTKFHWKTIILDEAQCVKNPESARHQSIKILQADFMIALTGTPIENSLLDLWAIMSIVVPSHLGSWKMFKKRFVKPIEVGNHTRLDDLKHLLDPFLKRRLKDDVTPDLPPKLEINEIIPLSLFERDTYDQVRQQAQTLIAQSPEKAKFQVLPLLTKLRQICCHRGLVIPSASDHSSKLDRAIEILEQLHQNNRKVLIFSQFVQLLQKLKERLLIKEWEFCYLDGKTPSHIRESEIERFQHGTPKIFLISLKAGGSGINLTSATEVIHLDPWWNPAIEDQASDRAHRIGQTQTVTVIRLLAEATIETQILRLQQEKRSIANNILGDNLSALTIQDISDMLIDP